MAQSDADLIIRNGTLVDGTGAAARRADVAVKGDRIVAVEERIDSKGAREIDATGRIVTPGFVDVHTHLDAQLAWDALPTSSCWHGITSAVLGNCGVTFAPVQPGQKEFLAEMMESVEDIPRDAILDGLPWDWTTYGDYLGWLDRTPKGINVGGLVGHCALRVAAMGDRAMVEGSGNAEEIARMAEMAEEAMRSGALGISTSRTLGHKVPDGRPVPGTWAEADELLAFGDVLGKVGYGLFEGAMRLGERDDDKLTKTRHEVAMLGEISRRSGRPVSYGLVQSDRRPDLYSKVIEFNVEENANGAHLRPQTTARGIGMIYNLANRTPWDRTASWRELRKLNLADRLAALRDPARRERLVEEGKAAKLVMTYEQLFVLPDGDARYDCKPEDSLAAHAARRGVSPVEAFIELALASNGALNVNYPILNHQLSAVEEMLDMDLITLGLADAGAHVGQIMDTSQPTFLLTYWVRERQRWTLEQAIRRLTSDTADLFGFKGRGRVQVGNYADLNVIDFDAMSLPQPEYVHDLPNGAGRYIQGSTGYDYTIVNGQVFMDHGEHVGTLAGRVVRSTD
ncbi:MAG: amidohydrolase family protein [Acidimicrobiales bacterium]|nr:amidohydrolase family protein [Acidimicrobiales bacterium]